MIKVMIVFGTRPEAIKMAPIIKEFKANDHLFDTKICVTGQHRELLDQVLNIFNIIPDFDLDIMKKDQDLFDITIRILNGMRGVFQVYKPDLVLVHGDTTTSSITSLAAFYMQIPVGHVEAGLRTYNMYSPWPEEMNRNLTSKLAILHFCPTKTSKTNLLNEGISENKISVTGNTVIDALFMASAYINNNKSALKEIEATIEAQGFSIDRLKERKLVLITGHRRENFGIGFQNILNAIQTLSVKYEDVDFLYPMHFNPNIRNPIDKIVNKQKLKNLFFIEPLDYLPFIFLMKNCYLILTDSGGIQEEAPSFGKPVVVMRESTERPEALEAGVIKLVGTNCDKIINQVSELIENQHLYTSMSTSVNPFGDGTASKRIVESLIKYYDIE